MEKTYIDEYLHFMCIKIFFQNLENQDKDQEEERKNNKTFQILLTNNSYFQSNRLTNSYT